MTLAPRSIVRSLPEVGVCSPSLAEMATRPPNRKTARLACAGAVGTLSVAPSGI